MTRRRPLPTRARLVIGALGVLGVLGVLALAVLVGAAIPDRPALAVLLAGAVLVLGISAVDHALVPLLSVPLLFVVARASAVGVDVSISDIALAVAVLPAALLTRRVSTPMRHLLWLIALYLVATLFTVVANPYPANAVEWVHAAVLLGGALFVGWTIGREGYGPAALTVMLVVGSLLAVVTVVAGIGQLLDGRFEAVYLEWPFSMHKNFIGCVLGVVAVIAYVAPDWLGVRRVVSLPVFALTVVAIGFAQSRQAIVGLAVAVLVLVLRTRTDRQRSRTILLVVLPVFVLVGVYVEGQISSANQFNSVQQRLTWFAESIDVWQTSPVVGVGLRWWYTDRFPVTFQPPNAELEVLTSAGVVGLLAFLVLVVGTLVVLWRLPPAYGNLALLAVLSRVVQGQFDLFWTAVTVSLPFVVAGICVGQLALTQERGAAAPDLPARGHPGRDRPGSVPVGAG